MPCLIEFNLPRDDSLSLTLPSRIANLSRPAGLALLYSVCAYLMNVLSVVHHDSTVFWMPNGIALAIMLARGGPIWPGIILGSAAAGFLFGQPLPVVAAMAAGNTVEVYSAFVLINLFGGDFDCDFSRPRDFIRILPAAILSAWISAVSGSFALLHAGLADTADLAGNVFHWWQANAMGMVIGTPFALVWRRLPRGWFGHAKRGLETHGYILLSLIAPTTLFMDFFRGMFGGISPEYWLFLLILWGAFRFGRHGVLLLLLIVASIGYLGIDRGAADFANHRQTGAQNFWHYLLVVAVAGILMALILHTRERAEEALRLKTAELDAYFNNALDLFGIADMQGRFRKMNARWQQILGYSIAELTGKPFLEFVHPDDIHATQEAMARLSASTSVNNFINRYRHQDGSWRWIQWNSTAKDGLIYAAARDITEQKTAEDELRLAALVYQNSSEAMMITDENDRIISINQAFTACTGYTLADVLGKNPRILNSGRQSPAFYQAMWQALNSSGRWQGEIYNRRKNSDIYVEWVVINTVFNPDGTVHRRVALFSDITEKKKSEELIWFQANYDPLTRLPNRRLFIDRLQQEVVKAERDRQTLGLLFVDLDRFKEVNDGLGHSMGDELLVQVAKRLCACVRKSDTVARLGGDEFTVIISELNDKIYVETIAQNILNALSQPFTLGSSLAYVSASIGITFSPTDASHVEDLIRFADQAMYAAKNKGRNMYCYFTPAMQKEVENHVHIARDLHAALADNQFAVYYQPIVELAMQDRVVKAEALIRWIHPAQGMIMPIEFIAIAEETGVINDIGDWIFREAAQQAKRWQQDYLSHFQISVNKSPSQFHTQDLVHSGWTDYLQRLDMPRDSIVVEITEGLLLDDSHNVAKKLLHFKEYGIQVAIDDFGTGYSALSYLKKFHIEYLKIDQSFTRNLAPGSSDLALCEAIIVMAHKLGIKVIAEGIETRQQRDFLAQAGCDYGQGYLFAKPMPAGEFELLLKAQQNPADTRD